MKLSRCTTVGNRENLARVLGVLALVVVAWWWLSRRSLVVVVLCKLTSLPDAGIAGIVGSKLYAFSGMGSFTHSQKTDTPFFSLFLVKIDGTLSNSQR